MNDNNDGPREDTFLGSAKNLEEHLAFMKSLRVRGGNEKPSNRPPKSDGHSAVPPNKREESVKGVSPLLIMLVLLMSALLVAVVSYSQKDKGTEKLRQIEVTKNDQVEVHVPGMQRAEQNISVQEKVTSQSNSNANQSSESGSAQVPAQASLPTNCARIIDLSFGKGYLLPRGECYLMGYTPNYVYIGAESPFTEITGADFIITTNDQSASCDSRRSPDRCTSWIGQNQKLGGEDSRLHKPRFWMLFQPFGDVFIHSSQSIVYPIALTLNKEIINTEKSFSCTTVEDVENGFAARNIEYINASTQSLRASAGCVLVVVSGTVSKVEGKRYRLSVPEPSKPGSFWNCGDMGGSNDADCTGFVNYWSGKEMRVAVLNRGYVNTK